MLIQLTRSSIKAQQIIIVTLLGTPCCELSDSVADGWGFCPSRSLLQTNQFTSATFKIPANLTNTHSLHPFSSLPRKWILHLLSLNPVWQIHTKQLVHWSHGTCTLNDLKEVLCCGNQMPAGSTETVSFPFIPVTCPSQQLTGFLADPLTPFMLLLNLRVSARICVCVCFPAESGSSKPAESHTWTTLVKILWQC